MEVFTQTFSNNIHPKLKKKKKHVLEQEILLPMNSILSKAKECKKERMFTSSLEGP